MSFKVPVTQVGRLCVWKAVEKRPPSNRRFAFGETGADRALAGSVGGQDVG